LAGDENAMMLIRFGELIDRRMTKLIQNRHPMTQKELVEEAMRECKNRERIKKGLKPIGEPTSFAKPASADREGALVTGPIIMQMPRLETNSPLMSQRSATISQASGIRAERDMTGKLRYDYSSPPPHPPLRGVDLPARIEAGSSSNGDDHARIAIATLAYEQGPLRKAPENGHDGASTPHQHPSFRATGDSALDNLLANIRARKT